MTKPTQDRNYYRMMRDKELVAEAKLRPSAELAVVLAERLRARD